MYVSVFGDERGKEVAIAGLKSKTKYVRSELGRRMKLRLTPEIRFIEDEAFERGSRVSIFRACFYGYLCMLTIGSLCCCVSTLSFSLSSLFSSLSRASFF